MTLLLNLLLSVLLRRVYLIRLFSAVRLLRPLNWVVIPPVAIAWTYTSLTVFLVRMDALELLIAAFVQPPPMG